MRDRRHRGSVCNPTTTRRTNMSKTMTIAELRKQLAAKEAKLAKLQMKRGKVAKQLAALDSEIASLGGGPVKTKRKGRKKVAKKTAARRGKRTKGGPSLADVLAKVLVGKGEMKVAEAAKLAIGAGYKSSSSQFGNIVSQTLSGDKRFKKIARGIYAMKGGRKPIAEKKVKMAVKKAARKVTPAKKQQSLGDVLAEVAKGRKLLGVADAARLVLAEGYKSKAANFPLAVNRTLMKDERFGRAGRGIYTLRGQEGGIPDEMLAKPVRKKTARKKTVKKVAKRTASKGSRTAKKAVKKRPKRKQSVRKIA